MKSKLSLTVVYIVLIIYFKVKLPEYTVAELENDLKITLYACYSDTLVPLWKHFVYDKDHNILMEDSCLQGNNAANGEDTSKKKDSDPKIGTRTKRSSLSSSSCFEYYDSWKIQDDLRIHPIEDLGPSKSSFDCNSNQITKSKQRYF